jgi:SET domain-containing protein
MKKLIQNVNVGLSPVHRFGVYAVADIDKGDVFEECPFIITGEEEKHPTIVQEYLFSGDTSKNTLIVFGYGSIYNHSKKNNADYFHDEKLDVISFYARKKIKKGEEIFVNYGSKYWKSRDSKPK